MAAPKADDAANRPVMRFLRSLGHGARAFLLPYPSVPPDQRVKTSFGCRTRSARRGQGWLVLTKDRLVFERSLMWGSPLHLLPSANITVDLRDVSEVQWLAGDLYDLSPFVPILSVKLVSGGELFFQLADCDVWLKILGEAIVLGPVKRTDDARPES